MPDSPATPDHGGQRIMDMLKTSECSAEKIDITGHQQEALLHEPSPASTYGDSTANSSTPITPQDNITGQYLFSK